MITTALARELDELGLVTYQADAAGGDVFVEEDLPPDPVDVVGLLSFGGAPADVKLGYDMPNVQVIVRGGAHARVPYARAQAIYDALHGMHAHTLPDGTYVVGCAADQSAPVRLGPDDSGRHRFSLNFAFDVRAVTTNRE